MGETTTAHMVLSRSLLLLLAALASTLVAAEMADWKRGLDAIVTKMQTKDHASAPVNDVDTLVPENRHPLELAQKGLNDELPSRLTKHQGYTSDDSSDGLAAEELAQEGLNDELPSRLTKHQGYTSDDSSDRLAAEELAQEGLNDE